MNYLFDTHTNLMWYPEHLSDEFVEFAWEAKKAKMNLTDDVYFAGKDTNESNAFDSRPDQLIKASENCNKVIVFGIIAPFSGINSNQETIAEFVKDNSDKFIGWCSVDPNDENCVKQLEHNVKELDFKGLKISPIYQNWDPQDSKHYPLFKKAEELGIPINIHQGTTFVRPGPLKFANPILLEDIAIACPKLRIIIAHMGHPWEDECVAIIRKHPNLYTNISAIHYRPVRHYHSIRTAIEYGVEHKLIFGSDFPSATAEQVIAGQWKVNEIIKGTSFPVIPDEVINNIIFENWKKALPEFI